MIAWGTIGPALCAWVRAGTGLDGNHVFWSKGTTRPAAMYVAMRFVSEEAIGTDWTEVDEDSEDTKTRGHRFITIGLQCFAGSGEDLPFGAATPFGILSQLKSRSKTQTLLEALDTADISAPAFGPLSSSEAIINSTVFEPRAMMEASFYVVSEITETVDDGASFIETAEITGLMPGDPDLPADRVIVIDVTITE